MTTSAEGNPDKDTPGWSGAGQSPPVPPGLQPPDHPGQTPVYRERSINGMAIASLVLGILWLWWLGSVLALVFGYIARSQIEKKGQSGAGLAIAGIVLGWVGIGALVFFMVLFGFTRGGVAG